MDYLNKFDIKTLKTVFWAIMIFAPFIMLIIQMVLIKLLDKKLYYPYERLWKVNDPFWGADFGTHFTDITMRAVKFGCVYCSSRVRKYNKELYDLMSRNLTNIEKKMLVVEHYSTMLFFLAMSPLLIGLFINLPDSFHEIYEIDEFRVAMSEKLSFLGISFVK